MSNTMAKDHNTKSCLQRLTCRGCTPSNPAMLRNNIPKAKTDSSQRISNPEYSSRKVKM